MDVVGDLVARERRSDAPALRVAASGREYDYRRLCTTAWKAGNYLRNEGVRGGMLVGVADDPVPETVLTFLGVALLGATTRFDPPPDVDAKALVVPVDALAGYDVGPRTRRVGYGGEPTDPAAGYFERDVPSENPTTPPDRVAPDAAALATDERTYAHATLLEAARAVADDWGLDDGDAVAVRAPLASPGTVAAGLLAPLLVGGTVLFPDGTARGDAAVGIDAPEPRAVAPRDVPL